MRIMMKVEGVVENCQVLCSGTLRWVEYVKASYKKTPEYFSLLIKNSKPYNFNNYSPHPLRPAGCKC
jgi:hypothetical protein